MSMILANTSVVDPAVMGWYFHSYFWVFVIAFGVTLLSTPIIRRIAIMLDVIDHPDESRKQHSRPIAYMGGVAVLLGVLAGIGLSYYQFLSTMISPVPGFFETIGLVNEVALTHKPVPLAVVIGIFAIAITGLGDDMWGAHPRIKIAGQLVAAAALAIDAIGVNVATGALQPIFGAPSEPLFEIGNFALPNSELYYWIGTALIAVFVLGGCNAANLIDGLDGLLSGVTGIFMLGTLVISLLIACQFNAQPLAPPQASLVGARVVLCLAVLGAVMGFLPHNFNPASIFLGDAGSLLLGYLCIVVILMMGELGQTHLVFAGLIVFSIPIADTILAIIRRKLSGRSMSDADDQHIHHRMKRRLGGVKQAVFAIYGIAFGLAALGILLSWLVLFTDLRARHVYPPIAIVIVGLILYAAANARRSYVKTKAVASTKPKSSSESQSAKT
ncbi:MAG: MraY family glycosyltransferase [Planctomycetota bacterium]